MRSPGCVSSTRRATPTRNYLGNYRARRPPACFQHPIPLPQRPWDHGSAGETPSLNSHKKKMRRGGAEWDRDERSPTRCWIHASAIPAPRYVTPSRGPCFPRQEGKRFFQGCAGVAVGFAARIAARQRTAVPQTWGLD